MSSIWNEVETENIYQHILKTEGEKDPLYSLENLEACADYILAEFKSYGLKTEVHEFKVDVLTTHLEMWRGSLVTEKVQNS